MLVIGLTGGIGSGKSTVANIFRQLGVPVIDTDEISRQLVEPGQAALAEIDAKFNDVLTLSGELDRAKLRQAIFDDPAKRELLEQILHPRIQLEVKNQLAHIQNSYAIVVVPLLVEKGTYSFIDRVLVIDCDEQLQLQRAMARDNQDRQQIERIIKTQASRQQRLEIADDVIINNADFEHLRKSVEKIDLTYRQLADN